MLTEISFNKASAKIDSKGAELKSLIIDGREIMWDSNPDYWGKSSPILFPAIGNVKNNETIADNQKIKMPKHGFARDYDFNLIRSSKSSAAFSCDFRPSQTGFPFKCCLTINYSIREDALFIKYNVINLDTVDMPFCIGAHPAIACNNLDKCTLEFERRETASTPVMNLETRLFESNNRIKRLSNGTKLPLSYDMFDNDVVYFDNIKSKSVTFKEGSKTLAKISYTGFETLGLWTPAGKRAGFLCIEPWCSSDDYDDDNGIFAEKKGIQIAKPRQMKEYTMTISAK